MSVDDQSINQSINQSSDTNIDIKVSEHELFLEYKPSTDMLKAKSQII